MSKIYTQQDIVDIEAILAEKWVWGNKARMLSTVNGWSNESAGNNIQLKIATAIMDAMDKLIAELGTEESEYSPPKPKELKGLDVDLNQNEIEKLLKAGVDMYLEKNTVYGTAGLEAKREHDKNSLVEIYGKSDFEYMSAKEWKPHTDYLKNDLVEYRGKKYLATASFTSGDEFSTKSLDIMTGDD